MSATKVAERSPELQQRHFRSADALWEIDMVLHKSRAKRLLIDAGLCCGLGAFSSETPALADEWAMSSPGELGIDADIGALIDQAVRQGDLPNLHAGAFF
jgi:hypothetical protein